MNAEIRAFLEKCQRQGYGFWRWPDGQTTEVSALYRLNWGGHYPAAECRDGCYYPAYYEVRLEAYDFVVLPATQLAPLLELPGPAAAIRALQEQARWPRAVEAAARAGVTAGRIGQLLHLGQLAGEKRGVEWYVDPASLDRWIAARRPGRPRNEAGHE